VLPSRSLFVPSGQVVFDQTMPVTIAPRERRGFCNLEFVRCSGGAPAESNVSTCESPPSLT